jgi:hypothetical protein
MPIAMNGTVWERSSYRQVPRQQFRCFTPSLQLFHTASCPCCDIIAQLTMHECRSGLSLVTQVVTKAFLNMVASRLAPFQGRLTSVVAVCRNKTRQITCTTRCSTGPPSVDDLSSSFPSRKRVMPRMRATARLQGHKPCGGDAEARVGKDNATDHARSQ